MEPCCSVIWRQLVQQQLLLNKQEATLMHFLKIRALMSHLVQLKKTPFANFQLIHLSKCFLRNVLIEEVFHQIKKPY
jgi:hypothetical protein